MVNLHKKIASLTKPFFLITYFYAEFGRVFARCQELGFSTTLFLYLSLLALLSITIVASAFIKMNSLRWSYAVTLAVLGVITNGYELGTGVHLTYDAFINMVHSVGFMEDAFRQFYIPIAQATFVASLLLFGIGLKPRSLPINISGRITATIPIFAMTVITVMLYLRGGDGAKGLLSPFIAGSYSLLLCYELINDAAGPRKLVSLPRSNPATGDIVLIVDESVSANYIDLVDSDNGVYSALLGPHPDINIFNYGVASSITNCSEGTNLTLRHGGTRSDYRRYNATMPSIWDYAKAAGMHTVYLDAQRTDRRFQNGMDKQESKSIDEFIQFDDVPVRDRDLAAADQIAKHLNKKTPVFIYVNKVGAHFPVQDKYPTSYMRYRPIAVRGENQNISDKPMKDVNKKTATEWQAYRNSYRNTLLWNVGAFFERLFGKGDLSKANIIYTSDHGQDLHERGNIGTNTHCSSAPVMEEGAVPLVVISGKKANTLDLVRAFNKNRNNSSHYHVFPTLLLLMGYERQSLRSIYGEPLDETFRDPMTFNILFNARLGQSPVWKKVEPLKLMAPPNDR